MARGAKPKIYPPELVEDVRRLYENGATQNEVAAALGMSQKIIFNVMRRHDIQARVAAKRNQWGAHNHAWKGDCASKYAFHRRLYSRYGKPTKCTVCGTVEAEHYDYANLSGKYEAIEDYAAMCRSCHSKFDGKITNITKGGMPNAQA